MRNGHQLRAFALTLVLYGLLTLPLVPAADPVPGARPASGSSLFDSYSRGNSVWLRSEINDSHLLALFDRIAQQVEVTNGRLTREQYHSYLAQRRAGRNSHSPPSDRTDSHTAASGMAAADGSEATSVTERWAETQFRQHDRNGDGLLNFDELPEALRVERSRWDKNGSGFIDLDEFKTYFQSRRHRVLQDVGRELPETPSNVAAERSETTSKIAASKEPAAADDAHQTTSPSINESVAKLLRDEIARGELRPVDVKGILPYERTDGPGKPEESRIANPPGSKIMAAPPATIYRAGKLPPDLPGWFQQLDQDGDGQVSLYEWRISGSSLDEFPRWDRNDDKFLTIAEVCYFEKRFPIKSAKK
jgi:Ca2+-binding EF-hand superfamily protein